MLMRETSRFDSGRGLRIFNNSHVVLVVKDV